MLGDTEIALSLRVQLIKPNSVQQLHRTTLNCTYVESDYTRTRKLCSLYRYGIYRRKPPSYYIIDQSLRLLVRFALLIETKHRISLF